jgi:DNA-binding winged helix-turn-helix (wHTH) protein/TolB-like protein
MRFEADFQIGPWTVRPLRGLLEAPGQTVRIEPRVTEVLCCLAANALQVVTREKFISTVWGGRVVTDEVLSRCISQLRTALGDDPRTPHFIETVPKVGYRLLVPVQFITRQTTQTPSASLPSPLGTTSGRRPTAMAFAAVIGLAFVLAAAGVYLRGASTTPRNVSTGTATTLTLAVLPLTSPQSSSSTDQRLAEGLSDEIRFRLARIPGVRVLGAVSSRQLALADGTLLQRARELGVTRLLTGTITPSDDRLQVYIKLLDIPGGETRWSHVINSTPSDNVDLPDQIALAVRPVLDPTGDAISVRNRPVRARDPELYRMYLIARGELLESSDASLTEAQQGYSQIIRRDPQFSEAHAGLAIASASQARFYGGGSLELQQRAMAAAEQAIALDPDSSEGYLARAMVERLRYETQGDISGYRAAGEDFRRAIALDPTNAFAYLNYGFSVSRDDPRFGNRLYQKALEIDPLLDAAHFHLAINDRSLGNYGKVLETLKRLSKHGLDPDEYYEQVLITERFAGHPHAAVAAARKTPPDLSAWGAYCDAGDFHSAHAVVADRSPGVSGALNEAANFAMAGRFTQEYAVLSEARLRFVTDGSLAAAAAHVALIIGRPRETVRIVGERFPGLFGDVEAINAYNLAAALDLTAAWQLLGNGEEANRMLDRIELYLNQPSAFRGPPMTLFRAAALALQGNDGEALAELERGLRSGYRMIWNVSLTPNLLPAPYSIEKDPRFGKLRDDPRVANWIARMRVANSLPDPSSASNGIQPP